jgi:large subunit ribosomal protein L15
MKVHHLRPADGATKDRTRMGRGRAGARGKTAGRGTKGTGARKNVPTYFEGGQMPYQRRVPKLKGFANPNRRQFAPVNVEVLAKYFDGEVTPELLYAHGLAHKGWPVKILGRGELGKALSVTAHAFSTTAKVKIEAAGGSVRTLGAGN